MTATRTRVDSGTSYETLLALATIADKRFARVFTGARDLDRTVRATAGPGLVDDVRRAGRFTWVNLLSLAATGRRPRTTQVLLETVAATMPSEVHRTVLGGRRRQLLDLVGAEVVTGVVGDDRGCRRTLRAALHSDDTVLEATPWALSASSEEVHGLVVGVIRAWSEHVEPQMEEATARQALRTEARRLRARLRDLSAPEVIREVAPGLAYTSASMPPELLVLPSPAVAPVIVFVDDVRRTIVACPPPSTRRPEDPVLAGARALGDPMRLRILDVLAEGPLAAADLARRVDQPRTTLLHHLALLRSAGLVLTSVGPSERTEYRLDHEAAAALGRAVGERYGIRY